MSTPFIGEIRMFGGNYAPSGWSFCDGQLLPIAQNTALFSLLGTTYGGDGESTFALPDLRGRLPVHQGSGPGLTNRFIGMKGGAESVTLTPSQLPSHTHDAGATTTEALTNDPTAGVPAVAERPAWAVGSSESGTLGSGAPTAAVGGGQAHNNMQPFLVVRFIIARVGIFPSAS